MLFRSRFLQLFHHTGYESVLEGEIIETGLGIVLRKKIRKLSHLFIFKDRNKNKTINDTIVNPELKNK